MLTLKSIPLYLLALLIFGFNLTQAQEQTTETNSLKPGAWALEFGITNNFTLSSFQGTTISAQYQCSATSAWRAGIGIIGNTQNSTGQQSPIPGDTITNSNSNNGSSSSEGISLKIQHLWYTNSEGITHFYAGVGPMVSYSHSHSNQQLMGSSNNLSNGTWNTDITINTSNTWSVGASALAGVEYFPVHVFSLHAEYGTSIAYQEQKTESASQSADNYGYPNSTGLNISSSSHLWSLNNGTVSFGISVYF